MVETCNFLFSVDSGCRALNLPNKQSKGVDCPVHEVGETLIIVQTLSSFRLQPFAQSLDALESSDILRILDIQRVAWCPERCGSVDGRCQHVRIGHDLVVIVVPLAV
jgi:hypothetical protein